jgi:flagellar basal body-associated protein FliL|tara:strand:- start:3816 stop:3959 length:144 start_codon:yes stop_codon:yes gene_type:complete
MTKDEKTTKLQELRARIIELKYRESTSNVKTKKTIQKLQQEIDNLTT